MKSLLLMLLVTRAITQSTNPNVNYFPRFGSSALKFVQLADNHCDEMRLHSCFAGMKPA